MSQQPNRSLARSSLHDHLQRLREANETAANNRRQYDSALDQVEHAQTMVRDTQTAVTALDAREAAQVSDVWPPKAPSPKAKEARAAAQDDLDRARRILSAVEQKAEALRGPSDQAQIAARNLSLETDALINAVLREEGMAAIANLATTQAAVARAEDEVDAIRSTLLTRQAFRDAEAVGFAVHKLRWPARAPDATRWHRFAERLAADPDAKMESAQ